MDYRDRPLSEFRMVEYLFRESSMYNKEVVHESQVEMFCEAILQLHYNPGINPHNREKTSEVITINVMRMEPSGPYWWTGPSLEGSDGATLYGRNYDRRWIRPEDVTGEEFAGGWY